LSWLVLCCCQAPVQCSKPSANSIRQGGATVSNHSKRFDGPACRHEKRNPVQGAFRGTAIEAFEITLFWRSDGDTVFGRSRAGEQVSTG
jgi:hypothetical protein